MNFHFPWFRKPSQPLRAVVATKSENLAAQRRRNDVTLQLAVYKAVTTPEQRKAETEEYFRRAREPGFEKAVRLGGWDGLKHDGMAVSPLKVGKA